MLLLEHLNLNVLSTEVALAFYEALGCRRDARRPMDKTLHSNCGPLTQFHTPSPANEAYIAGSGAQRWRGEIELVYESPESLAAAASRVAVLREAQLFAGTLLAVGSPTEDGSVKISGPYGNAFRLRVATGPELAALRPAAGWRPGSEQSQCIGMRGASLLVPPGTAERGAKFYEKVLGFSCQELGPGLWAVQGGPEQVQQLLLREVEGATGKEVGEHMAIYIADFEGSFQRLLQLGLIWVNPRFEHLDRSTTLEEATEYSCFRFKDVVDLETRELLFELEHEVRSVAHKSCPPALQAK